jgi:hypothetical protein
MLYQLLWQTPHMQRAKLRSCTMLWGRYACCNRGCRPSTRITSEVFVSHCGHIAGVVASIHIIDVVSCILHPCATTLYRYLLLLVRRQHMRQEEALEWQLESVKLLWAQGQPGIAVGTARALLAEARTALGPTCSTVARISTLLGSWLAESRSGSC